MGWLDQVPRAGKLYIGGLYSLRRRQAVEEAGLTHVVSVLRWPIDEELIKPYKHLQIDIDDTDDENILQFFPTTNRFIDDALESGGCVFVHCAMGKSRSATIVIAFLMYKYGISPQEALDQIRESRGVCEPNEGFWKQLKLYQQMSQPKTVEDNIIYQRWIYQRDLAESRTVNMAPEIEKIRFEDEHNKAAVDGGLDLRCRKCRQLLATTQYLIKHTPKQIAHKPKSPPVSPAACAHIFVDALSWMRPELEQGKLEGRLECPKCKTNVGKYAWQGMQCSCGDWVVPGISLQKGRIDEIKARPAGVVAVNTQAMGIRQPPGRGGQNL